jgi:hypothetical protein
MGEDAADYVLRVKAARCPDIADEVIPIELVLCDRRA